VSGALAQPDVVIDRAEQRDTLAAEVREGLARDGQFFRAEPAFPDPIRIHNGERGTTVRDVEADGKRIQQSPEDQQGIRFR